jgi:hypothetical protein
MFCTSCGKQLSAEVRFCVACGNAIAVGNQVENQVSNQVENQVSNQVENQVSNQVDNQVSNQVENQVENQVNIQVNNQPAPQTIHEPPPVTYQSDSQMTHREAQDKYDQMNRDNNSHKRKMAIFALLGAVAVFALASFFQSLGDSSMFSMYYYPNGFIVSLLVNISFYPGWAITILLLGAGVFLLFTSGGQLTRRDVEEWRTEVVKLRADGSMVEAKETEMKANELENVLNALGR